MNDVNEALSNENSVETQNESIKEKPMEIDEENKIIIQNDYKDLAKTDKTNSEIIKNGTNGAQKTINVEGTSENSSIAAAKKFMEDTQAELHNLKSQLAHLKEDSVDEIGSLRKSLSDIMLKLENIDPTIDEHVGVFREEAIEEAKSFAKALEAVGNVSAKEEANAINNEVEKGSDLDAEKLQNQPSNANNNADLPSVNAIEQEVKDQDEQDVGTNSGENKKPIVRENSTSAQYQYAGLWKPDDKSTIGSQPNEVKYSTQTSYEHEGNIKKSFLATDTSNKLDAKINSDKEKAEIKKVIYVPPKNIFKTTKTNFLTKKDNLMTNVHFDALQIEEKSEQNQIEIIKKYNKQIWELSQVFLKIDSDEVKVVSNYYPIKGELKSHEATIRKLANNFPVLASKKKETIEIIQKYVGIVEGKIEKMKNVP